MVVPTRKLHTSKAVNTYHKHFDKPVENNLQLLEHAHYARAGATIHDMYGTILKPGAFWSVDLNPVYTGL